MRFPAQIILDATLQNLRCVGKESATSLSVKSPYIFIGKDYLGTPWTSTLSFVMSPAASVWS